MTDRRASKTDISRASDFRLTVHLWETGGGGGG